VGVGGGFLIVPLLLLVYGVPAPVAAATSLAVVLLNAASGSFTYLRLRRVDVRTGLVLALGTVPGALMGPWVAERTPERLFRIIFAVFLLAMAVFLALRPERAAPGAVIRTGFGRVRARFQPPGGEMLEYSYSLPIALMLSLCVGLLSSMLGIGGGIVHVPAMIHVLGFPAHVATATSQFVLAITAGAGVLEYVRRALVDWHLALPLGLGVVIGAQVGAHFSHRVKGKRLVRLLSLAIVLLGLRLLWDAFR
jgi:uncharacterized protein